MMSESLNIMCLCICVVVEANACILVILLTDDFCISDGDNETCFLGLDDSSFRVIAMRIFDTGTFFLLITSLQIVVTVSLLQLNLL